jgi:hypothetical protein
MKHLILLTAFFASSVFGGELRVSDSQVVTGLAKSGLPSYILNPSCEKGKANITDTDNIVTRVSSGGLGDLGTDCQIDADASGEKAVFAWRAYPNRLEGGNCEVSGYYKGDASLYKVNVVQDSVVVNSLQLSNAASGQEYSIAFPCGADNADLVTVEIEATDNAAALINHVFLHGGEYQTFQVAQAEVVVRAVGNGSGQSIGDASDTKVTNWTEVTDVYSEFTSNTFTAKRAGNYLIAAQLRWPSLTTPVRCLVNVYKNGASVHISGQGNTSPCVAQVDVNISLAVGDTIEIYAFQDSAGSANIDGGPTPQWLQITRFPPASETVLKIGAAGSEWTSYTPASSWVSNTTVTGKYQCWNGNLAVQNQAATSGAPNSATLTFDLPTGFTINTNVLLSVGTQQSLFSEVKINDSGAAVYHGTVRYADSNTVTIINNGAAGTYVNEPSVVDQASPITFGAGDFVMASYIVPVNECPRTPMPLVKQAVTTSSAGVDRIESARFNQDGTLTSGSSWISSITAGTLADGSAVANFITGRFSATPDCTVTPASLVSATSVVSCGVTNASTSSVQVDCAYFNGSISLKNFDFPVVLMCKGPN